VTIKIKFHGYHYHKLASLNATRQWQFECLANGWECTVTGPFKEAIKIAKREYANIHRTSYGTLLVIGARDLIENPQLQFNF